MSKEVFSHADWIRELNSRELKEGTDFDCWGAGGPDVYLNSTKSVIEIKPRETTTMLKSAYKEFMDREGKSSNPDFYPSNLRRFVIATPSEGWYRVRVYINNDGKYNELDSPDIIFEPSQKKECIEYLTKEKISLDSRETVRNVLDLIYNGMRGINKLKCVETLLIMHKGDAKVSGSSVIITDGGEKIDFVDGLDDKTAKFIERDILGRYCVEDPDKVKSVVRSEWSSFQPDPRKSSLGKYYTMDHLVMAIRKMVEPHLTMYPNAVVMDLCSGCGAFLERFSDRKLIGRDIDGDAIKILERMGFDNVQQDNSLLHVSRDKYTLGTDDEVIIIGNPPWNDETSKNKRYGTDAKEKSGAVSSISRDQDLNNKDLGISFMIAYAKLNPEAICILHPLSYLIKKTNFRKLERLVNNYSLEDAIIFSSEEFGGNIGHTTPFPVVAALYRKGGNVTYEDVMKRVFLIFENSAGQLVPSGKKIVFGEYKSSDAYIRKYPPNKGESTTSDIGVYFYNFRDINSVRTSANFTEKAGPNVVPVQFVDLKKYAYMSCVKRYFPQSFVHGNLSPPYSEELEKDEVFADACIYDAIMNTQTISKFNRSNADSIIYTRGLLEDARRKKGDLLGSGVNPYEVFVKYCEGDDSQKQCMRDEFMEYFMRLLTQNENFSDKIIYFS